MCIFSQFMNIDRIHFKLIWFSNFSSKINNAEYTASAAILAFSRIDHFIAWYAATFRVMFAGI